MTIAPSRLPRLYEQCARRGDWETWESTQGIFFGHQKSAHMCNILNKDVTESWLQESLVALDNILRFLHEPTVDLSNELDHFSL